MIVPEAKCVKLLKSFQAHFEDYGSKSLWSSIVVLDTLTNRGMKSPESGYFQS
jgi:hypothetical protein